MLMITSHRQVRAIAVFNVVSILLLTAGCNTWGDRATDTPQPSATPPLEETVTPTEMQAAPEQDAQFQSGLCGNSYWPILDGASWTYQVTTEDASGMSESRIEVWSMIDLVASSYGEGGNFILRRGGDPTQGIHPTSDAFRCDETGILDLSTGFDPVLVLPPEAEFSIDRVWTTMRGPYETPLHLRSLEVQETLLGTFQVAGFDNQGEQVEFFIARSFARGIGMLSQTYSDDVQTATYELISYELPGNNPGGQPGSTSSTYIVQSGDTFSSIAQRFNLPISSLLEANGLTFNSPLYVGQTIFIPGGGSETPVVSHAMLGVRTAQWDGLDSLVIRDGSNLEVRRIRLGAGYNCGDMLWSPNGRSILMCGGGDIPLLLIDVETGTVSDLSSIRPDTTSFEWSPASDRILFGSSNDRGTSYAVLDLADMSMRTVVENYLMNSGEFWSPDGSSFIFTGQPSSEPANNGRITVVDVNSNAVYEFRELFGAWGISFLDGDQLLISGYQYSPTRDFDIFRIDLSARTWQIHIDNPWPEDFLHCFPSPDASRYACGRIAFSDQLSLAYLYDPGTAQFQLLNSIPYRGTGYYMFNWSPDGRYLLVDETGSSDDPTLLYELATGQSRQYNTNIFHYPGWNGITPQSWIDAEHFVLRYAPLNLIYMYDIAGLDTRTLCDGSTNFCSLYIPFEPSQESGPSYNEARVRYILADIQLGNVLGFYRAAQDSASIEAVRRWDAGIRLVNPGLFERKLINGQWLVVYAGTDTVVNGLDVLLTLE